MKRNQLPPIRLAPWEHLPHALPQDIEAPAQNVVPFQWRDETLQVAGRFACCGDGRCYLFARFIGEEDEANWVLGNGVSSEGPTQMPHGGRLKLSKRLSRVEKSHFWPFGRLFFFSVDELKAPQPFGAFISTQGYGCWMPSSGLLPWSWDETTPFRLPLNGGASLRHTPARDVRAHLLEAVHDSGSDAQFALDWRCQPEEEREKVLLKVERGSVEEFRHLLSCALRLETAVSEQRGSWNWLLTNDAPLLNYWSSGSQFAEWVDLPLRLKLWNRLVDEYFVPSLNHSLLHSHSCVQRWSTLRGYMLCITVESPTQHERLEAALFLRDWARGKVPAPKLKLLLSRV